MFRRQAPRFRFGGLLRLVTLTMLMMAAALALPGKALAQQVVASSVNPTSFTAADQTITFSYTISPGNYVVNSASASGVLGIAYSCSPSGGNYVCSGNYTTTALDVMSAQIGEQVEFTFTRAGYAPISFSSQYRQVLLEGGGDVSMSVEASPTTATPGASVTVSSTVGSMGCNSGLMPRGTVTLTVGPQSQTLTLVADQSYSTSDTVSFSTTTLPVGTHAVSAAYSGGAGDGGASACAAKTVTGTSVVVEAQPVPTITANGQTGNSVTFGVSFSAAVTGFAANDITVSSPGGGTATVSGGGASYTVTVAGMSASGTVGISIPAAAASTPAGTPSLAAALTSTAYAQMQITTSSLPNPVYGAAYTSTQIVTSASDGGPTFSITSGALPAGMSLSVGGVLSGTPTQVGTFSFTLLAVGPTGRSASRSFTLSIDAPIINVTPASVPNGTVGSSFIQVHAASGGIAPYSFAVSAGALPTGLSLSSAGNMAGTPTVAGQFSFTVQATDANGQTGSRFYTVVISAVSPGAPVISTAVGGDQSATVGFTAPAFNGGSPITSYTVTANPGGMTGTGASSPITVTGLTNGMNYTFTVTATNAAGTGAASAASNSVTPKAPQTITFANPGAQTVGTSQMLTATASSTLAVEFASTTGGVCSVTPTGSFTALTEGTCTITANQPGDAAFVAAPQVSRSFTINPLPPVAGNVLMTVAANSSANPVTLSLTGGNATTVAIASPAANGSAIASGTSISYTPAPGYSGSDSFTYTATNVSGTSAAATVTITVNPPPPVANPSAPAVAANSTGNAIAPSLTGGPAASLAIVTQPTNGTASVSGLSLIYTPTAGYSGSDTIAYTATNAGGTSGVATITVTVTAPDLVIAPSPLPDGQVDTAYTQTLSTTLGTAPYTYVSGGGTLPFGLTLMGNGLISGTPTLAGSFSFTVTATDIYGAIGNQAYTIVIEDLPPVAGSVAHFVDANSTDNVLASDLSGGPVTSLSIASPPSHGTATVQGTAFLYTPTGGFSSVDSFTYTATGPGGTSVPATVTVTVLADQLTTSPEQLAPARQGTAYSQSLSAQLGTAPYVFTATTPMPPGLTLSAGGVVSGTPTDFATYTVDVAVTDTYGATGTGFFTLVVAQEIPVAADSAVTVPANSADNPVPLTITGGPADVLASGLSPAHGDLLFNGTTATYTPDAGYSGPDSFTYTASNSGGTSAAATVTITVTAPDLVVGPAILADGQVGITYFDFLSAQDGTAPYTFAVTAGALPAGLTMAADGTIAGTPTVEGTYSFTVTATDAYGATGTVLASMEIAVELPGAADSALTVAANSGANPVPLTLSGGAADSITITQDPAHGSVVSTGPDVTYEPDPGWHGTDSFVYRAVNASGESADATVTVTVTAPDLVVGPALMADGQVGVSYFDFLSAQEGTAPYSFALTSGALPAGLTLAADGTVEGEPTAEGSYNFTVTATDALGATGMVTATIDVGIELPAAADSALTVAANSGPTAVPLSLSGGIADGITITEDVANGGLVVSGTDVTYQPDAGWHGTDSFTYVATNASGQSAPASVTVTVTAPTLDFVNTLDGGVVGTEYTGLMEAVSGTEPYSYAVTAGALPEGLTLATNGAVSGIPTTAGSFSFTVTATDDLGATGSAAFTVAIEQGTDLPMASDSTLTVAANSAAASVPLSLSGGSAESIAIEDTPAHGVLEVSGVMVSYQPDAGYSGPDSFTYTATNAAGTSAPATVSITVTAPELDLGPSSLADAGVGFSYAATLTASQGTAPYSFAVTSGSLPAGLVLAASGAISGTPTEAGDASFTVTATDANGATGAAEYTITVTEDEPPPQPPADESATIEPGQSVSFNITAGATGGDVTGGTVLSVSPAEAGTAEITGAATAMRASVPLTLTFTPAAGFSGTATVTYTLTGPGGTSAPAALFITVLAAPRADPLATGNAYALASAQSDAAVRAARGQIDGVNDRMRVLRSGACRSNDLSLSLTGPSGGAGDPATTAALSRSGCADRDISLWADASLTFGEWDDTDFGGALDHASRRVTLGIDRQFSDLAIGGLAVSYGRDTTDIGDDGSESETESLGVAVYLSYDLGNDFFIDSSLGAARLDFTSRRWIEGEGVMAEGERDGSQLFFSVAAGKSFGTVENPVEAWLRVSGSRSKLDAFTETGSTTALTFEEQTVESLVGAIGFSAGYMIETSDGILRPSFTGELSHEFADASSVGVSYADITGGTLYTRDGEARDRTDLSLGLGFDFVHEQGWNLGGEIGARVDGDGLASQELNLRWRMDF